MFLSPLSDVRIHRISVLQIVTNRRVNVRQRYGRILLKHFFSAGTLIESENKCVEPNASSSNANHSILVRGQWGWVR